MRALSHDHAPRTPSPLDITGPRDYAPRPMWVGHSQQRWLWIVLQGGRALPRIWPRVLAVVGLSVVVTVLYQRVDWFRLSLTPTPFALIGWPLAIFLGFRNSATYDRYWEGRKLWGALVNQTRS